MTQITGDTVKQLRDRTNLPMMDCKRALVKTAGDMDKAIAILREESGGAIDGVKDRPVGQGRIGFFHQPNAKAAMVEVLCESAPVAKSDVFVQLCNDIARQVAEANPKSVAELTSQPFVGDSTRTVRDRITEVFGLTQENMKVKRFHRGTGEIGTYCHHNGLVGAMLEVTGDNADADLLRDICMHIAALNPTAATRENLPAEVIAQEQAFARKQMNDDPRTAKKPSHIIETILTGKMNKWFAQHVLLEQPFVKDDSKTVGDLLKSANLRFVRYTRFQVGKVME